MKNWRYLVLLLYAVLTAWTTAHHEPWRDEAQAWLIARDLPLSALFSQINYEGTPALWHVILKPFAVLGAPYFTMHIIHLCIALIIAALVLFRSPFSPIFQILIVFSYFIFWEYVVIARNYSLSCLVLFLLAAMHSQRREKPYLYALLLFLLFNTNVHSLFPAAALTVLFMFDLYTSRQRSNRPSVISYIIVLGGAAIAIAQLIPASDNINQGLFYVFSWRAPFIAMANAFFPGIPRTAYITIGLGSLLVLTHLILFFYVSKRTLFILLSSYVGLFYIFTFKHTGSIRHHGFLLVMLLFALWITGEEKARISSAQLPGRLFFFSNVSMMLIIISLSLSSISAVNNHVKEYLFPFSGARQTARFLKTHITDSTVVAAYPAIKASALAPYLEEVPFWYPEINDYGTFITWNRDFEAGRGISIEEAIQRIENTFDEDSPVILVLDQVPADYFLGSYELMYWTGDTIFGYGEERFYVYSTSQKSPYPLAQVRSDKHVVVQMGVAATDTIDRFLLSGR